MSPVLSGCYLATKLSPLRGYSVQSTQPMPPASLVHVALWMGLTGGNRKARVCLSWNDVHGKIREAWVRFLADGDAMV